MGSIPGTVAAAVAILAGTPAGAMGAPPVPVLTAPAEVTAGAPVTLDASATTDPDGDLADLAWSLGDGAGGAGPGVTHVWAAPGRYTVVLDATDATGAGARATAVVRVLPPPGLVADRGAELTRRPWALLEIARPPGAVGMRIGAPPAAADGPVVPVRARVRWPLRGGDGPRTIVVGFVDAAGAEIPGGAVQDAIVVDRTAPSVAAARVSPAPEVPVCGAREAARAPRRLLQVEVRGVDRGSGPASAQVGRGSRPLSPWQDAEAPLGLSAEEGSTVAVRVRDRAGNTSAWRAVPVPSFPLPFAQSASLPFRDDCAGRRPTPADGLVPFWSDGVACSVGCRPAGARGGWPLKPFRRQHGIRAGLNERRAGSFHYGVDIQARDLQEVYAIQSGTARILRYEGADTRIQVGRFIYWHVYPAVADGQYVTAYSTLVGRVGRRKGHLHLSDVDAPDHYLNPLRPGGRVLAPYVDTLPPVIGVPAVGAAGDAAVAAYDPQSFRERTTYDTPVLAPAALAWRLFDARGRAVGPLRWALRGSQNLDFGLIDAVFAPVARTAGASCFAERPVCRPNWRYRLAGGLTPPVTADAAAPGLYRLSVYAWDWVGNATARDAWLAVSGGRATAAPAPAA